MILLSLNKGDTLDLSVSANYEVAPSANTYWGLDPLDLFTLVEGTYTGGEGAIDHLVDEDEFMSAIGGMTGKNQSSDAPKAFLNYILWDKEMNYISSGFHLISTAAQGVGVHETIGLNDIIADQEGYILRTRLEPLAFRGISLIFFYSTRTDQKETNHKIKINSL